MSLDSIMQEVIFDREALNRHTMDNAELQQELFILFFDQMPVYLDQLDEAIASGNQESWTMAAHGIKGSSRALGFTRLASLALESERSEPDIERLKVLRDQIDLANEAVSIDKAS